MKIWRDVQRLDLTSFHLELLTYEALAKDASPSLSDRFRKVLDYLQSGRVLEPMLDPANPDNVVSACVSRALKEKAAVHARWSLERTHLMEVLW